MELIWSLSDVPELRGFPPETRHVIIERCFEAAKQVPSAHAYWVCAPILAWVMLALMSGTVWSIAKDHSLPMAILAGTACVAGVAVFVIGLRFRMIASDRRILREGIARYATGGRLPICPQCDYDLRGTDGEACPECGGNVMLRLTG